MAEEKEEVLETQSADGAEVRDTDIVFFATRRNYQKAETRVQGLKARLVSLQETLAVMQQVIAEGLADE